VTSFQNAITSICVVVLSTLAPASVHAQAVAAPVKFGDISVGGSFRTRIESWNWFGDSPEGEYTYPGSLLRIGLTESRTSIDWQAEAAVPFVLGLPNNAVASGAQGALGLGANYFVANDNRTDRAKLFVKQAAIRFKQIAGVPGQSLKVGRFEFVDGTETTPQDATLAALKRDRIAHRLIGNFGFSHVGRSLDGAQYGLDRGAWNVTALAVRPTRGVFDLDGWDDLRINVFYGAVTRRVGGKGHAGEWRAFMVAYDDYRDGVLKVDNRALAARRADTSNVSLTTFGGHFLQTHETAAGTFDLLAWGAAQSGLWGTLVHRAAAFAIEAGWQPDAPLEPWIRGGWNYGSGDGDPHDNRHGTFFQLLPTPRVYARLPFFNMMNTSDAFGEAVLRPSKRIAIRGDVHALSLADGNDLWYQGGGAYQPSTFGYAGRPSNGQTSLATLVDLSVDVSVSSHLTVSAYAGRAAGQPVTDAIYTSGAARLAYVELLLRF
jgi:alginate export protein